MDSNNKSKLFWIGLFVSTGIIIFVLSILYLTDSSINTEFRFSVLFKNGMGVESGSEVKMLGQKIGQVSKVEILDNRNGVVVELSIIDQLGIKIPNNSIFKIYYFGNPKKLSNELFGLGYDLINNQGKWEIYKNE